MQTLAKMVHNSPNKQICRQQKLLAATPTASAVVALNVVVRAAQ